MADMHKIWNIDLGTEYREEELDGRRYIVVPMVMILEGVHTGSQGPVYYSIDELAKTPKMWNLKPIVIEHPFRGDTATDLEVYKRQSVGMVMNTHFTDGKLKAEAWIDIDKALEKCPTILEHIKHRLPMEISTGLFSELVLEEGVWNGEPYKGRIINIRADHLAILPQKQGACSLSDGAGLLINQRQEIDPNEVLNVISTVVNQEYVAGSNVVLDEEARKHLRDNDAKVNTTQREPEHEDKTNNKIEGGSQIQEFTTPDGFKVTIQAPGNKKFNVPKPDFAAGSSIDYTEDMIEEPEQEEEPLQDNARIVSKDEVEEGDKDVIELLDQFYNRANKILRTKNHRVALMNRDVVEFSPFDVATEDQLVRGETARYKEDRAPKLYKKQRERQAVQTSYMIPGSSNPNMYMDFAYQRSTEVERQALWSRELLSRFLADFISIETDYLDGLRARLAEVEDKISEESEMTEEGVELRNELSFLRPEIESVEPSIPQAKKILSGLQNGLTVYPNELLAKATRQSVADIKKAREKEFTYTKSADNDDDGIVQIDAGSEDSFAPVEVDNKWRFSNVEYKDGRRGFNPRKWYSDIAGFVKQAADMLVEQGKMAAENAAGISGVAASYATLMIGQVDFRQRIEEDLRGVPMNIRDRLVSDEERANVRDAFVKQRDKIDSAKELDTKIDGALDWLANNAEGGNSIFDKLNSALADVGRASKNITMRDELRFANDYDLTDYLEFLKSASKDAKKKKRPRSKVANARDGEDSAWVKDFQSLLDKYNSNSNADQKLLPYQLLLQLPAPDDTEHNLSPTQEKMLAVYQWFSQMGKGSKGNLPLQQARDKQGLEETISTLKEIGGVCASARFQIQHEKEIPGEYKEKLTKLAGVIDNFMEYITEYILPLSEYLDSRKNGIKAVKNEALVVFNACLCSVCPELYGTLDMLWEVLHPFHALPAFKSDMTNEQYDDLSYMAACLSVF